MKYRELLNNTSDFYDRKIQKLYVDDIKEKIPDRVADYGHEILEFEYTDQDGQRWVHTLKTPQSLLFDYKNNIHLFRQKFSGRGFIT